MKSITLRCFLAVGDVIPLTAAVRDLRLAYPKLNIYVQTRHPELWENNPHVTKIITAHDKAENVIDFNYSPVLSESNQNTRHFISAMHELIRRRTNVNVPMTRFGGDLHLNEQEKIRPSTVPAGPYWVLVCGGKTDFTTKWWNPEHAKAVVDHFRGRLEFVQLGRSDSKDTPAHVQFPVPGAINLINKTGIREMLSIIYWSEGVLCPITFAMHAAAAIPRRPEEIRNKPCVVTAGGREPPHWEAYPGHRYIHTIGQLDCCAEKACFARRAQLIKDGMIYNSVELCKRPVQVNDYLRVAQCMHMITPGKVVDAIEDYMYRPVGIPLTVLGAAQ